MTAAFSRLTSRVLAHLGQDSILRGEVVVPPRVIAIKHGVQFGGYGNETASRRGTGDYDIVVEHSVATIENSYLPKVGNRLQHPDGDYDLDVMSTNNGYATQFILRKHVAP